MNIPSMLRFNVAGPCRPELHYMIPAEARLPGLVTLVDHQACFVVHASKRCAHPPIPAADGEGAVASSPAPPTKKA